MNFGQDDIHQFEFLLRLCFLFLFLEVVSQSTPNLQHRQPDFVKHIDVVRERFFGFTCELHVGTGKMNQYGCRSLGNTSPTRVIKPISFPIYRLEGFGQQTSTLLIHQRHPIRESKNLDGLIPWQISTKDESNLDLEWVAIGHPRFAGHRRDKP